MVAAAAATAPTPPTPILFPPRLPASEKDARYDTPPTLSTKLKNSLQRLETGMAAEAVADRSGSSLTYVTVVKAVALDTELHARLDGGT